MSPLLLRTLTAVVGLPIVVAAVLVDPATFALLVAIAIGLGTWEFYRLGGIASQRLLAVPGAIAAVLLIAAAWAGFDPFLLLGAAVPVLLVCGLLQRDQAHALPSWSVAIAGIVYVAVPAVFFIWLRALPQGGLWVLLTLLTIFATDTGAYATGRLLGRHPMAPRVSPKKTWEGLAGGLVAAMVASGLLSIWFAMPYSVVFGFLLGLPIAILGQLGDLAESLLKRSAGAKDAGGLLPGHGGILDRLDSMTFAGIAIFFVASWITNATV